jgi:hypothetical protein
MLVPQVQIYKLLIIFVGQFLENLKEMMIHFIKE